MPWTRLRSFTLAASISLTDPKYSKSAFLREGPTPGKSSNADFNPDCVRFARKEAETIPPHLTDRPRRPPEDRGWTVSSAVPPCSSRARPLKRKQLPQNSRGREEERRKAEFCCLPSFLCEAVASPRRTDLLLQSVE